MYESEYRCVIKLNYLVIISFWFFISGHYYTAECQEPVLNISTTPEKNISGLEFSPDGSMLASLEEDGTVALWDMSTLRKIRTLNPEKVHSSNQIAFSNDGKWLITSGITFPEITLHNINPLSADYNTAYLIPTLNHEGVVKFIPYENNFIVLTTNNLFVFCPADKSIQEIQADITETTAMNYIFLNTVSITGGCLSADGNMIYLNLKNQASNPIMYYSDLVKKEGKLHLKNIRGSKTENGRNLFYENNKLLVIGYYGNICRIDLNEKGEPSGSRKYIAEPNSSALWIKQDTSYYSGNSFCTNHGIISIAGESITEFNFKGKILRRYPSLPRKITSYTVLRSSNTLAVSDETGQIYLFSTETGNLISTVIQQSPKASAMFFSNDLNYLYLGYNDGIIKQWNLRDNSVRISSVNHSGKMNVNAIPPPVYISAIDSITVNNELLFRYERFPGNYHESWVAKWFINKNFIRSSMYAGYESHYDIAIAAQYKKDLNTIDTSLQKKNKIFNKHRKGLKVDIRGQLFMFQKLVPVPDDTRITDAQFLEGTTCLAVLTLEGNILLYDTITLNTIGNMGIMGERGFYYFLNNNYYFASKEALRSMSYSINNHAIPIEQYDFIYNRPDFIMEKMPFADSSLIALYRRVHSKRKKSDATINIETDKIPEAKTVNSIPIETSDDEIDVQFKVTGNGSILDKFIVSMNGILIYEISNIQKSDTIVSVKISMNSGKNLLSVEATNTIGIKSLRREYVIVNQSKYKQYTYVVNIGAGVYQENNYNLDYAAKDAKDLTSYFKKQKNTRVLCITDTDVNKNLIENISAFIAPAGIHDRIYVFYSGHGLLNSDLEYFLSTYQVKFNNPSEGGIKYDDLVVMLENSPCRQKVLFLDACHSGEIDKEHTTLDTLNQTKDEAVIVFRSSAKAIASNAEAQESFQLARMLFTESGTTKGLSVIASAGGTEFALEGSKWNNGVFTYALLKGLKESLADMNGDNTIYLSELQYYLYETVKSLTQGMQSPGGRIENLRNDFDIK
jgi:WD40 repeat protein